MTAAAPGTPAGVPLPAPAGPRVLTTGPDGGEADGPVAGPATRPTGHVLWVEIQPGGAGVVLAVGCVAPPDAACRYAGGSCRAADSINGTIRRTAGVAGRFTGGSTVPIASGMPIRVARLGSGWFWDTAR